MIAPVRNPRTAEGRGSASLATARRAVASVLFRQRATEAAARPVAGRLAWSFVAWAVVVAASYFAFGAWWAIDR